MCKRKLPVLVVLCAVTWITSGPAHAVYVDSSWYVQLTNLTVGIGSYPQSWNPVAGSTAYINVVGSGSGSGARVWIPELTD